jgi:glycosyltransferase involved in cell wall biosynthesis
VRADAAAAPAAVTGTAPGTRPRDLFLVANNIDELGGLQRVAHMLAGLFAERGHRVRLIGIRPFEPRHDYASDGGGYATCVVGERSAADARQGRRPRGFEQPTPADIDYLDRLFGSVSDGIVICMQIHAMSWVAAAQTSHLRIIGQSHESFVASVGVSGARGSSRFRRIMKRYPDIDTFLLLTQADAEQFRRVGLNNTDVMPNPVTMRPSSVAALSNPTIITVGRVAAEKNHRALVEAFARIAPDHPEWSLKIFGDGDLRDTLTAQIREVGLSDRAFVMGPTSQVERELLDSSIFALSSDAEGLPLALVEAMTCGVPCVSYDCSPGIREIITDGVDGIVVPPGSVSDLAAGIRRLIEEPEVRARMAGEAVLSARRFSPDTVMRIWDDLFDTVQR